MKRPSTEELIRAAREALASGERGLPDYASWDMFPFVGDVQVRPLQDAAEEQPRHGVGGVDCNACQTPDEDYLWTDEHWRVRSTAKAPGLPVVLFLESRHHHDMADLPDAALDGFGRVVRRVEKALQSLGNVARVHMSRWGDGAEHFHVWFFPRPEGFLQGRGTFLCLWDDILPPRPEQEWLQTLADLRVALAAA